MPFGLKVWNSSNQVVIDSELPAFVEVRRGVMQNNGVVSSPFTHNLSPYKFLPTGGAITNDNEIIGLMPDVGDWVSFNFFSDPYLGDPQLQGLVFFDSYCSNAPTIPYVIFANRKTLPAPTGYGMACYDVSGGCTWSSDNLLYSIKHSGVIPRANLGDALYQSGFFSGGNCVFGSGGGWSVYSTQDDIRFMSARRTALNEYIFEKRPIYNESTNPDVPFQHLVYDFYYMIGKVS